MTTAQVAMIHRRCLDLKLTPSEALAAATIKPGPRLGPGDEICSIEPGKQADLVIWRVPTHEQIPYWPEADVVRTVIKRGWIVFQR